MDRSDRPPEGYSLRRDKLPNHVAIIMDGNGRWAEQRHKPRIFGHRCGADSVRAVVKASDDIGVRVLSLFAFSEENWGRPEYEVKGIITLLNTYLLKERDELHRANVQLRTMGRIERLPNKTKELLQESKDLMAANTGLVLNIALSYGGRQELVEACRSVAGEVKKGTLSPDDISSSHITQALDTWDLPDPDLLIRTSGEQRLSNFMLWQLAYTEQYFADVLWPDFRRPEYEEALAAYQNRNRRFGLLGKDRGERQEAISSSSAQGSMARD